MAPDDDRRGPLLAAKLRALVRRNTEASHLVAASFPGGATVQAGLEGWFYPDRNPVRGLGPALAWARQQELTSLHVVVDRDGGGLARRAQAFRQAPHVWLADDDRLVEVRPAPIAETVDPPTGAETLEALLDAAGVEVVKEHGELTGEVAGLEVARVAAEGDNLRLEVGVGRHDREAFALVHGELPTADALASVVETVREHRRPGAPSHPLNRLAADRWLRARLIDDPGRLGFRDLRAVPLTFRRSSVKEQYPAAAVGRHEDGRRIVVVCSVGVDLDLVPTAADVRLAAGLGAEGVDDLWLVLPGRDDLPVTRALAGQLIEPARIVPLPGDWRTWDGEDRPAT